MIKNSYTDTVNWQEVQTSLQERLRALKRGEKKDLAETLGISPAMLSQLISGNRAITRERAEELVRVLGGDMDYNVNWKSSNAGQGEK